MGPYMLAISLEDPQTKTLMHVHVYAHCIQYVDLLLVGKLASQCHLLSQNSYQGLLPLQRLNLHILENVLAVK